MSSDATVRAEIQQLADDVIQGGADSAAYRRLNDLLGKNLLHLQWYVEYLDLRSAVIERAEQETNDEFVEQFFENARASTNRKQFSWGLISAAGLSSLVAIACVVLCVLWVQSPPRQVGRIALASADAAWDGKDYIPGDVVRQGETITLDTGMATIELTNGVTVDLISPAWITLSSEGKVTLWDGTVTARVPEQATGFTVRTHDAEIVDLGTEFLVDRTAEQQTHVFVRKGRVEARLLDLNGLTTRVLDLVSGQAAKLSVGDQLAEEVDSLLGWSDTMDNVDRMRGGISRLGGVARATDEISADLRVSAMPTEQCFLVIPESKGIVLQDELKFTSRFGTASLPAGTRVDSYLVHYDPSGTAAPGARGSISFGKPIVAVLDSATDLKQSDDVFNTDDRLWSDDQLRGFEPEDELQLSDDRFTVTIRPAVTGNNLLDQCRILVLSE
ncbi:FecR family protein [Calycomorphotria hydatis]|uniref:FecR protein n=1 Tax=Calycomorphotria hydatis TaxID=2528027 RepID=A0A517T3G1_9PLAN|nr:FecR family protein [Calycomorphotria hydatis]QDT62918.1 FecR protein [Calycomorphotria hydatis]